MEQKINSEQKYIKDKSIKTLGNFVECLLLNDSEISYNNKNKNKQKMTNVFYNCENIAEDEIGDYKYSINFKENIYEQFVNESQQFDYIIKKNVNVNHKISNLNRQLTSNSININFDFDYNNKDYAFKKLDLLNILKKKSYDYYMQDSEINEIEEIKIDTDDDNVNYYKELAELTIQDASQIEIYDDFSFENLIKMSVICKKSLYDFLDCEYPY